MEWHQAVIVTDLAEAVDVLVAEARPIDELDAELERALRLLDEVGFDDAKRVIELLEVGHGRFADTHGADFLGLDQANRISAVEYLCERGCRHPSRAAATNDDDIFDEIILH